MKSYLYLFGNDGKKKPIPILKYQNQKNLEVLYKKTMEGVVNTPLQWTC